MKFYGCPALNKCQTPYPPIPQLSPPLQKNKQTKKQKNKKKLKCIERLGLMRHKFVVHLKILLLLVVSLQNNLPLAENGEDFISSQLK